MHTVLGTRHGGARRALLLRGCRIAGEAAAGAERDILIGEDGRIASIGNAWKQARM